MENKQTAVDFLKDKFIMIQWLLVRDEISRTKADEFLNEWSEKAKQIEKEQIIDAHGVKSRGGFRSNGEFFQETKTGEEYYNETYANDTTKGLPEEDSKRRAWHY